MRGKVQREVEGRDEAARTDRHALPHAHVALGAGADIERLDFAVVARGFFGGNAESVDQATHLAFGIGNGLPGFDAKGIGELVLALGKAADAMVEHVALLVGCKLGHGFGGADGTGDCLIDHVRRGERGAERDLARELVRHRKVGVRLHGLVAEIERVDVLEL